MSAMNATIPPPSDTALVRARRRPTAIVAMWIVELGIAWVLASPWSETVSAAFGQHPDGDRALWWEPGHQWLTDVYLKYGSSVRGLFSGTMMGLAAWLVVASLPLGALMAALSDDERPSFRRAVGRGAETFGRLVVVQVLALVALGVVLGLIGGIPAMILASRTETWSSPRAALVVTMLPMLVAGAIALFVFALADLARALVVRHGVSGWRAIVGAVRAPRASMALLGLSIPRWVASAGMIGFGAAFASASSSILLVALVHQLASLSRVGLRASVLARALRISDVVVAAPPATSSRAPSDR